MNRREILPICILVVVALIACILLAAPQWPQATTDDNSTATATDLTYLKTGISTVLTSIADSTQSAAESLSVSGPVSENDTEAVLGKLSATSPYTMSFAVISANGTITAVAPEAYAGSVGINIAESEPGATIVRTQEPFLSDAFVAQEGFTGIEIAWPIVSDEGVYNGSVLAMADPSVFVGEIVAPVEEEKGITVTVMQPDGFILYDRDPAQVGKNLFADLPFTTYPDLQVLGKNISANASGTGEYTFYTTSGESGDAVQKHADWDTISYLDKEWRIVIFRTVEA